MQGTAGMDFFKSLGAARNTSTYTLNHAVLREVRYHMRANATALSCQQIIERFLVRGVAVRGASKQFARFVELHMVPFFRGMVESFIAVGWCAYVLRRRKMASELGQETVLVPVVVPMEHARFELEANRTTHEFTMRCMQMDGMAQVRGVRFIFLNERQRYANDTLMCSPLSGILGELRYVEQMKKFAVQAEFVRTHPTIYLQGVNAPRGESSTASMTGAMHSGALAESHSNSISDALRAKVRGETVEEPLSDAQLFQRASTDIVSNIEFHAQQMDDFARGQNEQYYSLGLNYAPPHHHSLYVCPPGMQLAHRPDTPQPRTDQVEMDEHLSSKVLAAFGIPETIFAGNSRSARPRAQDRAVFNIMHINMFDATLENYRLAMRETFVRIYREIFKAEIDADRIIFRPPPLYEHYLQHLARQFDDISEGSKHITASKFSAGDYSSKIKEMRGELCAAVNAQLALVAASADWFAAEPNELAIGDCDACPAGNSFGLWEQFCGARPEDSGIDALETLAIARSLVLFAWVLAMVDALSCSALQLPRFALGIRCAAGILAGGAAILAHSKLSWTPRAGLVAAYAMPVLAVASAARACVFDDARR
ncbi:Hypothetical Protein FCC1311_048462 [Hondaea fermentalgiana]|uniref:Uncharacterized protein n=1 Tax=Hondaea fermentalgiana TaxID=2315210 RepID=A0A2R5GDJ2_9STRA|nr:Hypothetical Protein FCC1311_048462 [Hondaea fermentalgiana]|eukprot:GBG28625.1 Hypothetical Protein FCC1311_048462 [Hondaea fermentalgiana]